MSTVTRPVTQTALVAVYSASIYFNSIPSLRLIGSIKIPEPTKIVIAKPNAIILAGGCDLIIFLSFKLKPPPYITIL